MTGIITITQCSVGSNRVVINGKASPCLQVVDCRIAPVVLVLGQVSNLGHCPEANDPLDGQVCLVTAQRTD